MTKQARPPDERRAGATEPVSAHPYTTPFHRARQFLAPFFGCWRNLAPGNVSHLRAAAFSSSRSANALHTWRTF